MAISSTSASLITARFGACDFQVYFTRLVDSNQFAGAVDL